MHERDRFALELELRRQEWAADGGDELRTCNLEWQLRGPLLEAMAAIVLRPEPARVSCAVQSESSMGAAE